MNIHPTAIVSENAELGKNVTIGAYSIIHENVVIGDNTIVESYCELGVS
ncbi:N-acetyltransferase, partial [Vibrio parahaemolyticus]